MNDHLKMKRKRQVNVNILFSTSFFCSPIGCRFKDQVQGVRSSIDDITRMKVIEHDKTRKAYEAFIELNFHIRRPGAWINFNKLSTFLPSDLSYVVQNQVVFCQLWRLSRSLTLTNCFRRHALALNDEQLHLNNEILIKLNKTYWMR